jgi:hypothetical protein
MGGEIHGNGMACVIQIRPHCVNKMGKTQSKPSAERHGNGMVFVNLPLVFIVGAAVNRHIVQCVRKVVVHLRYDT